MGEPEPYNRSDFAGALAANAAAKPFNIGVLVATMAAGTLVGGPVLLVLLVALVVYLVACVRTFFDEEEADAVLTREREQRREQLAAGVKRLDLGTLAPPIREHVVAARRRERTIHEAIERSELPYEEVSEEVDGFVRAMERTAGRAQTLFDALRDNPPERVGARLDQARGESGKVELVEALEQQLRVQRRIEVQLGRFHDEMERMVIELDTVRGNLLSVSASEGSASQRELAGDVRSLRERMGTVAEGMAEAYEGGR
ncbi:MAG: hypothetical protein ACRDK0_12110 [Solirubrobacteraceae bacterium]